MGELATSQSQAREFQALLTAAKQILGAQDVPTVVATILDNVLSLGEADDASVWLLHETGQNLKLELARGTSTNTPQPGILVNQGLACDAMLTGEVVNVSDCRLAPPVLGWNVDRPGARSAIVVPLSAREQQLGVVVAWSRERDHFDVTREETLGTLAEYGALGITQSRESAERASLEQQLIQSHKMEAIGRLAEGVAHDFNNLLTTIGGFGELALLRLPALHPVREHVEEIIRAGDRGAALTRQLLAVSRRQPVDLGVIDLNAVVSSTERILRRLIREDIEVTSKLDPSLGGVEADPGQIQQILMNLVVNARDAIPGSGNLTIETANVEIDTASSRSKLSLRSGSYVMLSVADTGVGMDPDTLGHIFEPFFTTKMSGPGTGLGLSTMYGIVKQFGGDVAVNSEVGRGTIFKIYLPRVAGLADLARARDVQTKLPPGSETVLVIEDEDRLRALASLVLKSAGYVVLEAPRGDVALQIVEDRKGAVDLVLTDMVMPGLNGREVGDRLRSDFPGVKIIYMSGYSDDVILRNGLILGDVAFLAKPFSPTVLTRKVRQELDKVEASA